MESPKFRKFYEKTKDSFIKANFDEAILNDIYNACLTNLVYDEEKNMFKNKKNSKEYIFDVDRLQFYPKSHRLHDWDMFVEFDEKNTTFKDDDLIIMGGHVKSHNISVETNPVYLDYKWTYYTVIPNVIAKLKKIKQYDEYGELIELGIKDACTWLQYIKGVKDMFTIEVEGNSIASLEPYKTMKNYMSYIDEAQKNNYIIVKK